ncbi:hypothetical protein PTQ21_18620 [Paenibacillus marchantiae]|uniref:hypothetical protein n=1 Tax=Paenibacillus marchantiae TaxID=3026433 RepID=UPI00237AA1F7|nr:hypothetical protein [Paenibacillus marchantiae]WDQ30453.1 hypothetical protein PTQ21_18620 [Paenibacillus marchantiae]
MEIIKTLTHNNSISAYAYGGSTRSIQQCKKTMVARELIITFDSGEAMLQEDVRLATGEDINWWAEVSDEIPKDKYVICQDGIYIWKEIREWDGEDFDVVDMRFEKIS